MDAYNQETIFHLPGLFEFFNVYVDILENYTDNKKMFKDNIKIGSIYGIPGSCYWNGGRLILATPFSKTKLEQVRDCMQHYKIPVRFTFTNCLLEEKHLYDTYGNLILEIFNTGDNEVICNQEVLEHYIREKYKNRYKYISSTTKRLNTIENQEQELEKDYHLVVLDYDHNKDIKYLQSIKQKDKCELLCNAICQANCPRRALHYKTISQCQLNLDESTMLDCEYSHNDNLITAMKQKNFISPEDINEIYLPMGFKNFKLEGRAHHPLDFIEVLIYYLIKEEYKPLVRKHLQTLVW